MQMNSMHLARLLGNARLLCVNTLAEVHCRLCVARWLDDSHCMAVVVMGNCGCVPFACGSHLGRLF